MNVLIDNYNKKSVAVNKTDELICENCNSTLEYEERDVDIGAFGCAHVHCPLCEHDNYIDNGKHDLKLTVHNVEFPKHFWHTSMETGAIDCCDNEEVKEAIYRAIEYFRKHKSEPVWFTAFGNLYVVVQRYDGDESYEVTVTNNYYSTSIPFEEEDY